MHGSSSRLPSLGAPMIVGLNDIILELNDPALPADGLFERFSARCQSFIPHTSLWIVCSDTRERSPTCYLGPWAEQAIGLVPAFCRHIESHPQFMALCSGVASPVDAISDYIPLNQWRSTGMFTDVLREIGAADQLSSSVPLEEHLAFSIVINRDHWKFSPQERFFLRLLTPHVKQAWQARLPAAGTSFSDPFSPDFRCEMFVDFFGNVVSASDDGQRWLRETFGEKRGASAVMLPAFLKAWVGRKLGGFRKRTGSPPPAALTHSFSAGEVSFLATLHPGSRYHLHRLVITRASGRDERSIHRLAALGLSHRQAEVLHWLSQGKTNAEIAAILRISLFTVKAHLREIYPLLFVENRHAAAALAWRTLNTGG